MTKNVSLHWLLLRDFISSLLRVLVVLGLNATLKFIRPSSSSSSIFTCAQDIIDINKSPLHIYLSTNGWQWYGISQLLGSCYSNAHSIRWNAKRQSWFRTTSPNFWLTNSFLEPLQLRQHLLLLIPSDEWMSLLNQQLLSQVWFVITVWLGSLTVTCRTCNPEVTQGPRFKYAPGHCRVTTLGKLFTHMCLCHQAV